MIIDEDSADEAVLSELGQRLARTRLDRNQTQADVARQAGIAKRTLERMESGGSVQLTTLVRVCRVLGLLDRFESLLPGSAPSPMEQLRMRGRTRQRASGARKDTPPADTWRWGDDT